MSNCLYRKWGRETYETMLATSLSDDNCGIQPISAYKIQNSETLKVYPCLVGIFVNS